ncbi:MAG: hypothetical protein ACRD4X_01625 [Candidatus Acidiferrales bacterium]
MAILRRWSNRLGVASVLLFLAFWIFVHSTVDLDAFPHGVYIEFALTWGIISVATVAAVLAAIGGKKWWLLSLIGPLVGAMFMLSAGV